MRLLCKAYHDETFREEDIIIGNIDRRNVLPLLDNSPGLLHPFFKASTSQPGQGSRPPLPTPSCKRANFAFSITSLQALKSLAMKNVTVDSFISTDDALSAFIWQCVTRARLSHTDSTSRSTFGRTVDMARYLDIPITYPGLVVQKILSSCDVQGIFDRPLGDVASQLRSDLISPGLAEKRRRTLPQSHIRATSRPSPEVAHFLCPRTSC